MTCFNPNHFSSPRTTRSGSHHNINWEETYDESTHMYSIMYNVTAHTSFGITYQLTHLEISDRLYGLFIDNSDGCPYLRINSYNIDIFHRERNNGNIIYNVESNMVSL